MQSSVLNSISSERPVLIAGPTASGKSALALEIAARSGGVIVNADALQVFGNWRVLTARPDPAEEAIAPHRLFGHVARDADYSVGHWLRDAVPSLGGGERPIFVGGTGLYFSALTKGLADIPRTPIAIRVEADLRMSAEGAGALLAELDEATRLRIDEKNPVRVQRAWEVLRATGRSLAAWQDDTPAPALPLAQADPLLLVAGRDWLADRIERRFDRMLAHGALDEVRRNLPDWDPALPSSKAIGASELVEHLRGRITLDEAVEAAKTATRQYAKRQRTWFRTRMSDWQTVELP